MENWNDLLFACMATSVNTAITLLYLISAVFIGNYVFLNLLMAILLENFDNMESNEDI
jgi:hypothetical protein